MGYLVTVRADRTILKEELQEFLDTVLDYKRCPTRLYTPDERQRPYDPLGAEASDEIWVGGNGDRLLPVRYVERMMRWFRKVKHVRMSADWSNM